MALGGHFGHRPADRADALAAAFDAAGGTGAELIGHRMGGAVALVLALRRPRIVSPLVLTEANLDASPPPEAWSSGIASHEGDAFVAAGYARVLENVGLLWAATVRLADLRALRRSVVGLRRGSGPIMRTILEGLSVDCVHLQASSAVNSMGGKTGGRGCARADVPDAGHHVMCDNPDAFVAAVAGQV